MYKIKVNEDLNFEMSRENGELIVNGDNPEPDIRQINAFSYHVIQNLRSYNAEVISFDSVTKTAEIKVNDHTYHLSAVRLQHAG